MNTIILLYLYAYINNTIVLFYRSYSFNLIHYAYLKHVRYFFLTQSSLAHCQSLNSTKLLICIYFFAMCGTVQAMQFKIKKKDEHTDILTVLAFVVKIHFRS